MLIAQVKINLKKKSDHLGQRTTSNTLILGWKYYEVLL